MATTMALTVMACGDEPRDVDDDDGQGGTSAAVGTNGAGAMAGSVTGTGASTGTTMGGACEHAGEAEPAAVEGITAAHNQVRCNVDTAEPIPPIAWSSQLAAVAQAYAEQLAAAGCNLNHSGGPYGENLFWGSGSYAPDVVVEAWAGEVSCFSYAQFENSCSCTCGHYTQIVWRNSTQLGCGVGACPGGGQVWVCNYDPPGNYLGQYPY